MEYISEVYLNESENEFLVKRELAKNTGVAERAARFMVGDITNEDKEHLNKFHRRYTPPII